MSPPRISDCTNIPNILSSVSVPLDLKIDQCEHSFLEILFIQMVLLLNISISWCCRKALLCFWTLLTLSEKTGGRHVASRAVVILTAAFLSRVAVVLLVPFCQAPSRSESMGVRNRKAILICEWLCIYCGRQHCFIVRILIPTHIGIIECPLTNTSCAWGSIFLCNTERLLSRTICPWACCH